MTHNLFPPNYANPPLRPELTQLLERLQPGQRIRVTQTVRVGMKTWPAVAVGVFRHVDALATGLATERVPADDIIVPIIHFTKDNGELSSVAVDENTQVEVLEGDAVPPAPAPTHALPADADKVPPPDRQPATRLANPQ